MQTALPEQTQAISSKGNCSKFYYTNPFFWWNTNTWVCSQLLVAFNVEKQKRASGFHISGIVNGTGQPVILSPVTANSRCLGKADYPPHITRPGGPSRAHSPQHAAAQGSPAGGVVLVSSSPFFSPVTCPIVFWPHINFWYAVGCLMRSQAARSSYSSAALVLSPAMDTFVRGSEQWFLSHFLQVTEEDRLHPRALGLSLST